MGLDQRIKTGRSVQVHAGVGLLYPGRDREGCGAVSCSHFHEVVLLGSNLSFSHIHTHIPKENTLKHLDVSSLLVMLAHIAQRTQKWQEMRMAERVM